MLTAALCRAARAGLDWTREELAERANLAVRTIADFERGAREPHENNRRAILAVFEGAGVVFKDGCVCLPSPEGPAEIKSA